MSLSKRVKMSLTKLVKMSVMGDAPTMAAAVVGTEVSVNICLFYHSNGQATAGRYMRTGNLHEAVGFDGKILKDVVRYVECPSITCEHSDVAIVSISGGCFQGLQIYSEVFVEPTDFILRDHDAELTEFRSRNPDRHHGPIDDGDEQVALSDQMIEHTEFVQTH